MGRRSDHNKEELKALLIEAAVELVEKEGLQQFTARRIAAKIGYSVGTLYNVFDDMEGLILHVNVQTLERLVQTIENDMKKLNAKEKLGGSVSRVYLKFAREHPALWVLLFETPTTTRPDWYQKIVAKKLLQIETLLAPFLGIPLAKMKRTCTILWASLHGICMLSRKGKLAESQTEEMCNELFQTYLRGIANT